MAPVETWILAPDFTYVPNGPIKLGNIIPDPHRPLKALSTLDLDAPFHTSVQHDYIRSQDRGRTVHGGLWAHFLQSVVGIGAEANREMGVTDEYQVDQLETRYLIGHPPVPASEEEKRLRARLDEPQVRRIIEPRAFGRRRRRRRRRLYMICGLKIARGLHVRTSVKRAVGGALSADVPVAPDGVLASIGGELGASWRHELTQSYRGGEEEVVFAYQLMAIRVWGRHGQEELDVDVCDFKDWRSSSSRPIMAQEPTAAHPQGADPEQDESEGDELEEEQLDGEGLEGEDLEVQLEVSYSEEEGSEENDHEGDDPEGDNPIGRDSGRDDSEADNEGMEITTTMADVKDFWGSGFTVESTEVQDERGDTVICVTTLVDNDEEWVD
ncbi:hypothetical protein PG996_006614 [Apiospora saccharicola]|uniref:Uncharacterized protein n=1 Tax=Apiospora saccharicola TaxID=335842 RepID=A0ABR1V8H4_9PEZI